MKVAVCCCTYLRSHLLGQVVESFFRQDYPAKDRELVILDDAGEYDPMKREGWQLVSVARRFANLGWKRNASIALAAADAPIIVLADDDDVYLPHWIASHVRALRSCVEGGRPAISRPSQVLYEEPEGFRRHYTGGLYQGGWAFTRDAFLKVGGYGPFDNGEDQEFLARLELAGVETVDPLADGTPPFYCFREANSSYHLSYGPDYRDLGQRAHNGRKTALDVRWPIDYAAKPILDTVHPRPF